MIAPTIPGVRELTLVGVGGTARVFRGLDEGGRPVAVKVAHGRSGARLAREGAALRALGPPAVPAFVAEGVAAEGAPYLVMELLEGEPLSAWAAALPGAGAAPLADVVELALGLGDVLDRVHAAGLVHRDVKPENLFLRAGAGGLRDRLALLDFGLARPIAEREWAAQGDPLELTRGGQRLGTAWYMAPEQGIEPRAVDPRADVYAAGVVLFELATGRPPFVGDSTTVVQAHVARRPPHPSEVAPVPAALDAPLLRALAKDRAQRQASVSELAAALAAAARLRSEGPRTGRRLVPLVASRLRAPITQIAAAAAAEGGHVARIHGERQVLVFPAAATPEKGLVSALRAAQRLVALGGNAPVVVHVAEVQIRESARGLAVAGPAVEKPAEWLPSGARPGILVTPEAAAFVDADAPEASRIDYLVAGVPVSDRTAARHTLGEEPPPPMLGRGDALGGTLVAIRGGWADGAPVIVEISGDEGTGRSRLLHEIARALRDEAVVLVVEVPPPGWAASETALVPPPAEPRPTVLCIDDVHHADERTLAQLAAWGEGAGLRAVVVTRPSGELAVTPEWWTPAWRHTEIVLRPLADEDAVALASTLIGPLEGDAPAVAARVARLGAQRPGDIVALVRALWATGALRRTRGGARQLAADEPLLGESLAPLPARIATRVLADLPRPLSDLAGLAAVLGARILPEEVVGVLDQPVAYAIGELDPGAALFRLVRAGLLEVRAGIGFRFPSASLRRAVERTLPAGVRRQHHDAVLRWLLGSARRDEATLHRIVRHAGATGLTEEVTSAHVLLAEAAEASGRPRAALAHFGAALALLGPGDPRRVPLEAAIRRGGF